MIQTVSLEGRRVTVALRAGERIVTVGDDLYLRRGDTQRRVLWVRVDERTDRISEIVASNKPVQA